MNINSQTSMTDHTTNKPTLQRIDPVSYDALTRKYGKLWRDAATRDELIGYADWLEDQHNLAASETVKLGRELQNKTRLINQQDKERMSICGALRAIGVRLNPDNTLVRVESTKAVNHPQFRAITSWYKVIPGSDGEIEVFNHIEYEHTDAKNPTLTGKPAAGKWGKQFKWLTVLDVVVESDQE